MYININLNISQTALNVILMVITVCFVISKLTLKIKFKNDEIENEDNYKEDENDSK